jgi:Asp-tRNA(Asn)/Glu-tRNA(Gln) amidotransferase A subunit family amidase
MSDDIEKEAQALRQADRFGAYVAIRPDRSFVTNGPLTGVRIAVKDNIAVAGLPFTAGHPCFAKRIAAIDAEAVQRLRSAGGRVTGVTRTDAGGFGVTTPEVENPMAPGFTVGGSSGGAAAAVAAGLADIGLGTDTGGSVRIPAACCELFAFKPTHGRVPLEGVWPLAPSLDHIGLLAREFELIVAGAVALLGGPLIETVARPKFGVDMARMHHYDPEVAQNFLAAIGRIREAGFTVAPIELPERDAVVATHSTLVLAEARTIYADLWPAHAAHLAEPALQGLLLAYQLDQEAIECAQASARKIIAEFNMAFRHVDAVLTPTLAVATPRAGTRAVMLAGKKVPTVAALVAETCLANVTGSPALVLPLALGLGAKPVSLQIMAPRDKDATLLRYGAFLQAMVASPPLC